MARQHQADNMPCGVVVADEIIKSIKRLPLDRSSPHSIGAKELRLSQLNFLRDKLGEGDGTYQFFKQQVTQNIILSIIGLAFLKKTFDNSNINTHQINPKTLQK